VYKREGLKSRQTNETVGGIPAVSLCSGAQVLKKNGDNHEMQVGAEIK
jgi:hypothetical protein